MSKAYLFAVMLLVTPFTGCIIEPVDDTPSLRSAVDNYYTFFSSTKDHDWEDFCENLLNPDGTYYNDSSLEECTETLELNEETWKLEKGEYKTVITNYTEKEQIGYNGPVYDVDVDEDFCFRLNSTDSWECEPDGTFQMTWALIDGKWSVAQQGLDEYGDGPTPSVSMFSSKTSEEIYYLEIIKVSRESALTNYNFFLKDDAGATYGGSNGFGEVAMQNMSGELHGINCRYGGDDGGLIDRRSDVCNDDGAKFPVRFYDNDYDGKLTSGDQFQIFGNLTGGWTEGPAKDDWGFDLRWKNGEATSWTIKLG
tara:strand:- start:752 stop:1681 length:930 start_codon:yes stop_codon:yes gene_type:complete